MGTKEEFIYDNPLGVVVAFFILMATAFTFIFRLTMTFMLGGGIAGGLMALLLGAVWFKQNK